MAPSTSYRTQVLAELEAIPDEYLPYLIQVVRSFRESVNLKPAAASFRQGWQEALRGETYPVTTLWEGIDAE
jgi:hypothetical protein